MEVKELSQSQLQQSDRAESGRSSCKVLEEKNQLVRLMKTKEAYTLEELWELRRAVEEEQQIQMTLKNNNPCKVHIQCKHFKSKKCCFQMTFKAELNRCVSSPASPISSFLEHPQNKQLQHAPFSFLSAPASSLIQGYLPQPDKDAALDRPNDVNIKHPISEESVIFPPSRSLLGEVAATSQQQSNSCASVTLACQTNQAGITLSSQQILLHESGTRKKEEGNEARLISQQSRQTQQQTQSKASTSEPFNDQKQFSHTLDMFQEVMLHEESDCSSSKILPHIYSGNNNHTFDITGPILLPETEASPELPQPSNLPNNVQTPIVGESLTSQIHENPTVTSFKTNENGQILFKLSNFRLQHRNHPVMSDEEYSVHLAKRWLEGHTEKIERIYSRLRAQKGASFKITPKIIKKVLQDEFDVDIYARCTEKVHRKLLKKKLDNLIKAIRLHERQTEDKPITSNTKKPSTKRTSASSIKTSTKQTASQSQENNQKLTNEEIKDEEENEENQHQSQLSSSTAHSAISLEEASEEIEIEDNFDKIKIAENFENDADDSSSFRPLKLTCQSSQQNQQDLPYPTESSQQKVIKEEWESFLALDPPYRAMHAH